MRRNACRLVLVCAAVVVAVRPATAQEVLDSLKAIAIIEQKVMMPMRDGVRLATDIYRPKTDEPVPTIFVRTPYNFAVYRDRELRAGRLFAPLDAVRRGYAYIVQNERGKFFSEGELLKMPLGVQEHHALLDGLHMGRLYARVQEYFDHPDLFLG